jgi:putative oxidoreductase
MKYVVLIGRIFYSLIFILSALSNFSEGTIAYASSAGLPMAALLTPLSGVIALAGGLSILLGYRAKVGAWLIVIFLVPVTFIMHSFWGLVDLQTAIIQQIMFMKNLSMLGAALLITYFGSGPFSLRNN